MKKVLLTLLSVVLFCNVRADEGMWIPMLIGKNIQQMQQMGWQLSAEDIYSINHASLKDAIVHFGGGCTGEMISQNGLLITNHHCGYGNIADVSTVQNNYLVDGFWAKSLKEEIPAKGLSVKFLVYMQDVTKFITPSTRKFKTKEAFNKERQRVSEKIIKDASEGGRYQAQISSFYNDNQFFLLVYEVFTDVRLVATPPKSLGKYGGDTDNWMWPRHTADFSIFRVYAGRDNKPAEYSASNVPYRPKKYLPISIADIKSNDFALIMGYPGRTNRYATSHELDMSINEVNPSIVKIRDQRLGVMSKYMRNDEAIDLKLTDEYARIANYWKYFIGQTEQLKRLKVIEQKRKEESEYNKWAAKNNMNTNLINQFSKVVSAYRPYAKSVVYYSEAFYGSSLVRMAAMSLSLYDELKKDKPNPDVVKSLTTGLSSVRKSLIESYEEKVDKELFLVTSKLMYYDLPKDQLPNIYNDLLASYGNNFETAISQYADAMYAQSLFNDDVKFAAFVNNPTATALEQDLATKYAYAFMNKFRKDINPKREKYMEEKSDLSQEYMAGLMKMHDGKLLYPDANSTMRVAYGKVGGYAPKDAVYYDYKTTIDGLLAKYIPGDPEFDLPEDFITLAKSKDYGRYADANGDLIVNFLTDNDITGGNSGSPVINAKGELIGLAFDGNWEAMSGDIAYDKKYKKTIVVDSRFVLWLIEKYGKADNLIREMDIRE